MSTLIDRVHAEQSPYLFCLKLAGADVQLYNSFGSYQGEWVAKVVTPAGESGWILDCYGSCSGCDAFEADFGWAYEWDEGTEDRMRAFGERYLDTLRTLGEVKDHFERTSSWDSGAEAALKWLEEVA